MDRAFDSNAIKAQIENLAAERDRIDSAIRSLEAALETIEQAIPVQGQLRYPPDISLQEAVKNTCLRMVDGITRQRVLSAVERTYSELEPKSSSVAAALVNLSKGENAMLKTAEEGRGSAPSIYSTEGSITLILSKDEIDVLMDESATHGTGGWQSLWMALRGNFDKSSGRIMLDPGLRSRIYKYYHNYGVGGWQSRVKKVFRRQMPHFFLI